MIFFLFRLFGVYFIVLESLFVLIKTFTMLSLNLRPVLKARGIEKPYTFLVKAGLLSHSSTKVLNNKTKVFRLKHIELLCKVLLCEPNDLLTWKPDKDEIYADKLPLIKLRQSETVNDWKKTLDKMPFQELKEVTKRISEKE